MRILYVGDVVGRPGRNAVTTLCPQLRKELALDAIIINCENAASGKGVTPEIADQLLKIADALVSGNHIWHYRSIETYLDQEPRLVRPANYPNAPGRGSYVLNTKVGRLGIIQVEGRVFMRTLECPFAAVERELRAMEGVRCVFVDIHGEATSEKQALAWHFDGQVSAVLGTHTHVQTADERVLPQGTAFMTDVGMTGPYDSVIGMESRASIERFLTQRRTPHEVATGNTWLCGALVELDDATGHAVKIERIKRVLE